VGTRCADHVTPLYPQKLALTSPTGGGRSVGKVRVRTKATEFEFFILYYITIFSSWLGLRRTPSQLLSLQHIPTQHDMLPQHPDCKNKLNWEYCNITLRKEQQSSLMMI